jgi:hypothetical protein
MASFPLCVRQMFEQWHTTSPDPNILQTMNNTSYSKNIITCVLKNYCALLIMPYTEFSYYSLIDYNFSY